MAVLIGPTGTEGTQSTPKALSGSTTINVEGVSDGSYVEIYVQNPGDSAAAKVGETLRGIGAQNLTLTGSQFHVKLVHVGPDTMVTVTDTV